MFVLALTPHAVNSQWVTDETDAAIALEKQGHLRFFSLDVQPCRAPPLWDVYQHVPFRSRYRDGLTALLNILEPKPAPMPPPVMPVPAPARQYVHTRPLPPKKAVGLPGWLLSLVGIAAVTVLVGLTIAALSNPPTTPATPTATATIPPPPSPSAVIYEVKSGDTIEGIALEHCLG